MRRRALYNSWDCREKRTWIFCKQQARLAGSSALYAGGFSIGRPALTNKGVLMMTKNQKLLSWVKEIEALCKPDRVK